MLSDLAVDGFTVIVVVGEGAIDRCQGQVGIMLKQFVGRQSVEQNRHDHGADGDPSVDQPRAASTDFWICDDVWMGHKRHGISVADSWLEGKPVT